MTGGDSADAAIARLKRAYDRQAVMAIVGIVVVAAFFVLDFSDHARTVETLTRVLPWFVGLSILSSSSTAGRSGSSRKPSYVITSRPAARESEGVSSEGAKPAPKSRMTKAPSGPTFRPSRPTRREAN